MKALLLITMFSFSSLAFSATSSEVVEALDQSLSNHVLDCKDSRDPEGFKSSNLIIDGLEDFKMTISDSSQPAIVFDYSDGHFDSNIQFFTDESLSIVKGVKAVTYNVSIRKTNVGTLIAPVFKDVRHKELSYTIECK